MRHPFQHFVWFHLWAFVVFYVLFAGLTVMALRAGSESDRKVYWIARATVGAVTGPFAGGIVRGMQGCCVKAGVTLLPYCAMVLVAGVALQMIPLPFQRFSKVFRAAAWCVGVLGWFAGVPLSLLHALS